MTIENSLDLLIHDIKQCQLCLDELEHSPNPILQLSSLAKILLIGQAPGRLAHTHCRPFSDPSGERLRDWCGLDYPTFYDPNYLAIMPMAFCFPGKLKNSSGDKPPPKRCSLTWHDKLKAQLPNIELTLLVGRYAAMRYVTDFKDLTTRVRTQAIETSPLILLPHPSPRNNIWLKKNDWFEQETLPRLKQRLKKITQCE